MSNPTQAQGNPVAERAPDDQDRDRLDDLTNRLQQAAARLRDGQLTQQEAADLLLECAKLAADAGGELEARTRPVGSPGQESLL